MRPGFTVRTAEWPTDEPALHALRHEVFVEEQRVPESLEWDGLDPQCVHAIAEAEGRAIACGRLLPDGHIGRMAVRRAWRGRGVGGAVLAYLIVLARDGGHARVVLNAQTHALPFYARYGFAPVGPEFIEAGIPHQAMELFLTGEVPGPRRA